MRQTSLLLVLWMVACGGDDAWVPDAAPAPDAARMADAGPVVPDDSPAGKQLAWVLAALNGASVSGSEAATHFTADFLARVSGAQVAAVFDQLSAGQPWTLTGYDGARDPRRLVAVVTRADGQYWRIGVATRESEGDRMSALALALSGDLDPALQTFAQLDSALAALAPEVNLELASVDDQACTPLHTLHPDASLAIGSAFKLYVLAGLAQSIADGARTWTDTIAIQDAWKSLPSGELQDQPAGTLLPVLTFAQKMISISDNTAADHLLFTVGRDRVEAQLAATGHHAPGEDAPFLSTRELFTLKLMLSDAEQDAYVAADADARRALLDGYDADPARDPRTFAGTWTTPRRIDRLEWFATPADLCNVMRTLKLFGDAPATAPVRDVLSINAGLIDFHHDFSWIGFKGGSEPGVLDLTWIVQRASDGAYRFLTVGVNDPAHALDEDRVVYVAGAARALLAK